MLIQLNSRSSSLLPRSLVKCVYPKRKGAYESFSSACRTRSSASANRLTRCAWTLINVPILNALPMFQAKREGSERSMHSMASTLHSTRLLARCGSGKNVHSVSNLCFFTLLVYHFFVHCVFAIPTSCFPARFTCAFFNFSSTFPNLFSS